MADAMHASHCREPGCRARTAEESDADAILDADDLLVTDLRCPTCGGRMEVDSGIFHEDLAGLVEACPDCRRDGRSTGRRDVVAVDAEAWWLLVALLRAVKDFADEEPELPLCVWDPLDACLANPVLAVEVES
jgi:hypothetical protein